MELISIVFLPSDIFIKLSISIKLNLLFEILCQSLLSPYFTFYSSDSLWIVLLICNSNFFCRFLDCLVGDFKIYITGLHQIFFYKQLQPVLFKPFHKAEGKCRKNNLLKSIFMCYAILEGLHSIQSKGYS